MTLGLRAILWAVGTAAILGACWCGVEFFTLASKTDAQDAYLRVWIALAGGALLTAAAFAFGLDRVAEALRERAQAATIVPSPPRAVTYLEDAPLESKSED